MFLISLILLIIIGIILLVLEILILPGLIAGIIGVIFMIMGNVLMYKNFGNVIGNITLISTLIVSFGTLTYALKSGAWKHFSLKGTIDSKVIDLPETNLNVGDEGIAVSALRPMGTVMIGENRVEAQSTENYIDANSKVVVTKVLSNKVLVKLKSDN